MPQLKNQKKLLGLRNANAARAAEAAASRNGEENAVPAANMNLEFNASSQGGGGSSSNGSNDATSSSVILDGETIAHDMGFGTAAGQMVASAISSSRLGHS